jgi:enoyl-[acyl-carrier protein] reductase I
MMKGKRGLIMGVANDHSIAWGIAKTLADARRGARLHLSGRSLRPRVKPLAESVGSDLLLPCDVEDIATVDAVFDKLKVRMGQHRFPGARHRLFRQVGAARANMPTRRGTISPAPW